MASKENPIRIFLKSLFEKLDQKMLKQAQAKPCCSKKEKKESSCSS